MFETAHKQVVESPTPSQSPASQTAQLNVAESRLDPLSGDWTIFATERSKRPDDFIDQVPGVKTDVECPFCQGNESTTPPAVWVGQIPETARILGSISDCDESPIDDWSVRVVPNKYPALNDICEAEMDSFRVSPSHRDSNLFRSQPICGGHEVIIESRRHVKSLTQLDMAEIDLVFQAYRDRLKHYRSMPGIAYTNVFKNVGRTAGASLTHAHSQLIATDRMPRIVESRVDRMRRHRAETGCCLSCDLLRAERKAKQRVVACDDTLIAYCPFASHLPMLVRLTTLEHQACFEDLGDRVLESVSRMVYRVITWLERLRPGTAYNYYINTRPPGIKDPTDSFHWSLDIFPRMTQVAGFEWSSGCMINPVFPETAAAMYRKCVSAENPRRFR